MRLAYLFFPVFVSFLFATQDPVPIPDRTFDLSTIAIHSAVSGSTFSVEFLTDNTIAVCRHLQTTGCELSFLVLDGHGVEKVNSSIAEKQQVMLRVGPDHLLTTSLTDPISQTHSVESAVVETVPKFSPYLVSASGKTAGFATDKNWIVYELVPSVKKLREGTGVLLSVSDSKVAIRDGNTIRIKTVDGQQLGSFGVKPVTRCWTDITLLSNELYLRSCGRQSIADWNGRELRKVSPPHGNATKIQANERGSRLLLDYSTRHVSILQSAGELAQTVASGGVGAPDQLDNGEAVRVLDVSTGAVCFEFAARLPHEVNASFAHASLSPSGRVLAIAQGPTLAIYRLPEDCSQH